MTFENGDCAARTPKALRDLRIRRVEGSAVVSMRLWLPGGSRLESRPGLAWVTGRMLTEGTERRDWKEIARASDGLGMVLGSFGGLEAHGISLDCLSRDWHQGLRWLAELALESSFPGDRCAWTIRQGIADLKSLMDQPEAKASWAFAEQLYGEHAAGRPPTGTVAGLEAINADLCAELHDRSLARGAVLTVAGLLDEDEVQAEIERLFGEPGAEMQTCEAPPPPASETQGRREIITSARDQAHLFVGHLTVPRSDPDMAALQLLSIILGAGAGLTGRIPDRVREKEGLAYSAAASAVSGAGLDPGRLVVHVGTSPDTLSRAEQCVREEIVRLLEQGVEPEELESARSYLLRREPFHRETPQQWAELLAASVLYQLPLDDPEWVNERYQAPTREDVETAARRHLDADRLKVTAGLPSSTRTQGIGAPASS